MFLAETYVPGHKKEFMVQERKKKQQISHGIQCKSTGFGLGIGF